MDVYDDNLFDIHQETNQTSQETNQIPQETNQIKSDEQKIEDFYTMYFDYAKNHSSEEDTKQIDNPYNEDFYTMYFNYNKETPEQELNFITSASLAYPT